MERINKRAAVFIGESVIRYRSKLIEFHPTKKFGEAGIKYVGCASKDFLQIATGGNFQTWFEIFIHETSHLDQHLERPRWFAHRQRKIYQFEEWLEGKNNSLEWKDVCQVIELEHDCEERSIKKIKKQDLPVNLKQYVQKANDYLIKYVLAYDLHRWPSSKRGAWKEKPKELLSLSDLIL